MSKVTFVLLATVAALSVQGLPFQSKELAEAAKSGNWDKFRQLLSQNVGFNNWPAPLSGDIRSLSAREPGTHVYGHAVSTFMSSSSINGHRSEFSAGHKVINNNGNIDEYDFKP